MTFPLKIPITSGNNTVKIGKRGTSQHTKQHREMAIKVNLLVNH